MYICFIKYKEFVQSGHPLLDGTELYSTKIIETNNLLSLNDEYPNLVDIKILDKK